MYLWKIIFWGILIELEAIAGDKNMNVQTFTLGPIIRNHKLDKFENQGVHLWSRLSETISSSV